MHFTKSILATSVLLAISASSWAANAQWVDKPANLEAVEIQQRETVSTETTYEFTVDKNVELTANFKKTEKPVEKVTITVKANDSKMGTVKLDPAKESYENGEIVTAIATAKEGYKFVNWTVAGKVVSDKAEYKFKVDRAAELQANFVKVSEDPKPENPKDEDKAVQTGDNGVSPIIPLAGLMLAAGAAVVALRKKED